MATDARVTAAGPARRSGRLPLGVRIMLKVSAKGLPDPVCEAAVEWGIEVPAADGSPMLTDHYIPLTGRPAPTVLVRTPYGRGFPWNSLFGGSFARQGFHVVIQSCRGTGGSGGKFEPWLHERADGQAAMKWLREQEWFSGSLGTIGPSYLGYVQWCLAAARPPELRAMVVQNGATSLRSFVYRGGSFALEDVLIGAAAMVSFEHGFLRLALAMARLQRGRRRATRLLPLIDSYRAAFGRRVDFVERWMTAEDPDDPYWRQCEAGAGPGSLGVPVSLVSGWHDVCLDQTLEQYRLLKECGDEVSLLVGPYTHTSGFDKGWPVLFPDALAWLRAHLDGPEGGSPRVGSAGGDAPGKVRVYVQGTDAWRDLPCWPPGAAAQQWFTEESGRLAAEPPSRTSHSVICYDPKDPTPSVGGAVLNARQAGSVRNDSLEARRDVLTFTSAPLGEALEIIGPVSARLQVRGSSPAFDVFARLCDVDPRGHSRNVCDGLVRQGAGAAGAGAARTGGAGWAEVTVPMSATAYRFEPGHRIRLQVSGGAHPRFARNNGTGEPIATATGLAAVNIELRHGSDGADPPAALLLPVSAAVGSGVPAGGDGGNG